MAETVAPALSGGSKPELGGEVRVSTAFHARRYATDASHYQMMPVGVVTPRTIDEQSSDSDWTRSKV